MPTAPLLSSLSTLDPRRLLVAWHGAGVVAGDLAVPRRLRWMLYLAFGLLVAVLVLQSLHSHHHAARQERETLAHVLAAQQQQRVARLAAALPTLQPPLVSRLAAETAADMGAEAVTETAVATATLVQEPDAQASLLLLAADLHSAAPALQAAIVDAAPAVQQALQRWSAAWAAAHATVQSLPAATDFVRTDPAGADPVTHPPGIKAARAQIDAAHAAAQALTTALQAQSGQHTQQHQHQALAWMLGAPVLLALLALAVVEPSVRQVRGQLARLGEQSQHLRMLATVAEHTQAIVMITDRDDRILWANDAFTRLTGWTLEEAVGKPPGALIHHPDIGPDALTALRTAVVAGHSARVECLNRTRDGQDMWLDCDLQPVHDASGALLGFVSVNHDSTDRRRLQEQLHASARTDALTQLPNRAVVIERLRRAVAHAYRHPNYGFAVLFMDFDRFKQVNDTLGHGAGDELLRQIAARLEHALRPGDGVGRVDSQLQLAARLGGDEFVVVLEGVGDAATVCQIADRLLLSLQRPYQLGVHSVQSAASIGIVLGGQGAARGLPAAVAGDFSAEAVDAEAEAVLRDADTAMYEAKRSRRGGWVLFNPAMQESVVHTLRMEQDLKHALQRDELFVVYQPVVHLPGGVLSGVEALVRWRHPTRGLVSPVEFVGIAEECGLIDAIGGFVLRAACRQFAQWQQTLGAAAPPLLAVNLSSAQLREPGLVPEVKWVLQEAGMRPEQLQLEVTESLAAQGRHVQATLRELKALGVTLALDDFGTGYSSLACLDQLPVDTVKIDRSFVAHAQDVEYRRVLIEATIRVARTLGMDTVAEGIETPEQAAHMALLGCDMGQGYHFGRPLSGADLAAWVRARTAVVPGAPAVATATRVHAIQEPDTASPALTS